MPVETAQFTMANRLTGGNLEAIIRDKRAAGKSFDKISRELFADHGVSVTAQTVSNWWRDIRPTEKAG